MFICLKINLIPFKTNNPLLVIYGRSIDLELTKNDYNMSSIVTFIVNIFVLELIYIYKYSKSTKHEKSFYKFELKFNKLFRAILP